ncbi:MAG TPA: GH3 auxin-responsive promoter family protein, partial [Panacibacter sp.]|nr:GH3 auxin-responsive promoter family protein [Panacibacter sp.]
AFGEHVIAEEVEYALLKAANEEGLKIVEFTVAPMVEQGQEKSYHEWFIEFENKPADINSFKEKVDNNLRSKNVYYDDLIAGNILQELKITPVNKNGFIDYMKSIGRLGGQNKLPRLSNDRKIAEDLKPYTV